MSTHDEHLTDDQAGQRILTWDEQKALLRQWARAVADYGRQSYQNAEALQAAQAVAAACVLPIVATAELAADQDEPPVSLGLWGAIRALHDLTANVAAALSVAGPEQIENPEMVDQPMAEALSVMLALAGYIAEALVDAELELGAKVRAE